MATLAEITGPLTPGVRVSLELPEAGTCVAVVASQDETTLVLDLLDEIPDGELEAGSRLDLFMPRNEGIYHWPCALSSAPVGQRAEIELLNLPMFVQRRLGHRVEAALQAQVRRIHAARRGRPHEMVVADLSQGGLKLHGDYHLSTGDTIEVTLELSPTAQVMGRVVMAYPTGPADWSVHVSFLDGQPDAAEALDAYITRQLRHQATSRR
jgi:PilZ domain